MHTEHLLHPRLEFTKAYCNFQNRVTAHTGLTDFPNGQVRHLARLTPQAEVPYARIDMPYQVSVPQGASDAKWTGENDVIVK